MNTQPRQKMEASSLLHFLLIVHLTFSRSAVNGQKQVVVTQPEVVRAEAGGTVAITCSFASYIPSYSVTWTLGCNTSEKLQDLTCFQRRINISSPDPGQTPHSPHGEPNYEVNVTIIIINLTESDSGTFCCHVKTPNMAGTGPGTRLEVTPRSIPAEPIQAVCLLVEIIHIACLIILIILLGIAVKKSC
ncbi:myelin protein P0-like [Bufo gargarizans]|uniref:myelin protein P0-like n=1 Tax=Bufo gargarizans TaxID=30331 RepID=UPI001CF53CA5|nr:myelin protein P0-like [Bufo gargarizans]